MSVCEFIANYFCCCICVNRKRQNSRKSEKHREMKDIEKNEKSDGHGKPKEDKVIILLFKIES